MKCTGMNILTQEIKLRGQSDDDPNEFRGEFRKITLSEYRPKKDQVTPAANNPASPIRTASSQPVTTPATS